MNARIPSIGLCVACFGVALVSCDSSLEVDFADYDPLPALDELDYSRVEPAEALDYWEYRFAFQGLGPPDSVIGFGGTRTKESLSSDLRASFDSTRAEDGFGVRCLPGHCYKYIVAVQDNQLLIWATADELVDFLGVIGSREEAIMLVDGHRYFWSPVDKLEGAIRDIEGGFEFVVMKTVEFCAPVQTNRYLLRVSRTGVISELQEEIRYKDDNACI